jgi:hypothetical protein
MSFGPKGSGGTCAIVPPGGVANRDSASCAMRIACDEDGRVSECSQRACPSSDGTTPKKANMSPGMEHGQRILGRQTHRRLIHGLDVAQRWLRLCGRVPVAACRHCLGKSHKATLRTTAGGRTPSLTHRAAALSTCPPPRPRRNKGAEEGAQEFRDVITAACRGRWPSHQARRPLAVSSGSSSGPVAASSASRRAAESGIGRLAR